jgi:hypothetical protein
LSWELRAGWCKLARQGDHEKMLAASLKRRTRRIALTVCFLSLAVASAALPAGKPDAVTPDGGRYYGALADGRLHGRGRLVWPNGNVYEGEFANGVMSGRGRYADASGAVWEGTFADGQLDGPGKSTGPRGSYEGGFKQWRFHGQGVLRLPNGDVYKGGFAEGFYEGQGTLTYARPRDDGRTQESGPWRYGMPAKEAQRKDARSNVETALYAQKPLLDKALASLKPREPGRINLYLLAIAGDGSQEVFRREVQFVQAEFARRFGTEGRSVALINSRNTVGSAPMATITSIRQALNAIAGRMNRQEDILFFFLTSHGSREHELTLGQSGMELPGLRAPELARLLKESGIRWRVIVVSACYSGGFIDMLRDERSLVMTAARRDRRSFGCADENDFTYFGRAFFKESLPKARSFVEAFRRAEALVGEWERKDARGDDHRSLPQIANAVGIDEHLKRWWSQSPR